MANEEKELAPTEGPAAEVEPEVAATSEELAAEAEPVAEPVAEEKPAGKKKKKGHGHGHGHGAGAAAATASSDGASRAQSKGYVVIAIVYLLGLFIGALDMGIVNPARTVIQNTLGVEDQLGVWVMTIYTLAYAASIPVMGKLADKYGRKYIYLACIVLFGVGSLFCGLAQDFASFEMLIAARAVQALGGGGIVPIATAEFGTAFPEEKRGMALGLVGAVYGIASVFGASAGSAILDIFGQNNWQFIFYINVPICLFVMLAGFKKLPNSKVEDVKPIDGLGICVMTVMVLSLMYGLKSIDFFDITNSIVSTEVYPFLLAFVILLPIFVFIEKRAADPVMNLSYFKDRDIVVTLICSIFTGVIMMATLFLPQFSENALFMRSGSGGYLFIILGIFAGLGSPMSGTLIDKFGVKVVLAFGFIASILGALFMAFVACSHPSLITVVVTLALIGLGMGFTMGTPLNYMMLQKTDEKESNSALATLSLVRSIGTAVAPAIMVAFVAHAGLNMQTNIMNVLPNQVEVSPLPYAQELDEELAEMRADEDFAEMFEGVEIPTLSSYNVIEVEMEEDAGNGIELSQELEDKMMNSDVTTIVDVVKEMAVYMYGQVRPEIEAEALEGIQTAITEMESARDEMSDGISEMNSGIASMNSTISEMEAAVKAAEDAMAGMGSGEMPGMGSGEMPEGMGSMADVGKLDEMKAGISSMKSSVSSMKASVSDMQAARDELSDTIMKLEAVEAAIPGLFDEAQTNYLAEIDAHAMDIQIAYQQTLNEGFSDMFVFVAVCSLIGTALLMLYRDDRRKEEEDEECAEDVEGVVAA